MKRNTKKCVKCNREISLSNYDKHLYSCTGEYFTGANKPRFDHPNIVDNLCPDCGIKFDSKRQTLLHYWKCHTIIGLKHNPNIGYCLGTREPISQFSKKFNYKGVHLQSSWELEVAQDLDNNTIKWVRPKHGFEWLDRNRIVRKYYPDFYLPDYNVYLDPKNKFLRKKDAYKISYCRKKYKIQILILTEFQLNWKEILKIMDQ